MRRATSGQILLGFALFASLAYSVYIVRQTDATFRRTESAPAIVLKALTTHTDTRPNIVVIMADDLDAGLFQTLISGGYLPNIKTYLADAGTAFTNSFVTTSLCCPSRATFLTGQYSHNHGVPTNVLPNGGVTLFDDDSTLATWLNDAGYIVGHIGKYLNGYGSNSGAPITSPLNPKYVPPGYDYWRGLVDNSTYKVYNYKINFDGNTVKSYGSGAANYQTDVLSGMAVNFINGVEPYDAMPFFLLIAPLAPHQEPYGPSTGCAADFWSRTIRPAPRHIGSLSALVLPQPTSFNEANVSDKPPYISQLPLMTAQEIGCAGKKYRDRAEAMRAVDDMVGSVVSALSTKGELTNTVIIFTSDNGFYLGQHRLANKTIGYEEGIRVPLVIRAPGYAGQQTTRYALNTDLAPTIAAFAGVTQTLVMDGRSLTPVMQNPTLADWRRRFLVEFLGGTAYDFSSVRTTDLDTLPERYYVEWLGGSLEYYDLSIDPYQESSQHNNPATAPQRQTLSQHLGNLQSCGSGSCQALEDAP